jgi:hypothetical protein
MNHYFCGMAKTTVKDLKFDNRNANKHSEYGMQRLEKSIGKIGLGRSILISDDNEIIAGNGVTESAINAGIENVRIIETDGSEIIAVKRTDIKSGSKEFYEMALSDNIIAKENIVMDVEVTNAICEEYELEDYATRYDKGLGVNGMTDDDISLDEEFDPMGTMDGKQRVVFLFDGSKEAESYLNSLKVDFKKMNMAWQVNMCTQSI